ncbi:PilN domain-containing protein [Candidatus Dojkabacteria bacterium]|uniref:PilN domain-containing protein n=1 Tax=Candidatus Dojkabacteria bacterium TaxID=2099670 RepID=A0A955RHR7_9BACT|nr:PilN domain-containing protein [Candidatus Dojkabacteria bacterium]
MKQGINLFKTEKVKRKEESDVRYTYVFASLTVLTLSIGALMGMFIWKGTVNRQLDNVNKDISKVEGQIESPENVAIRQKVYELNRKAELIQPIVEKDVNLNKAIDSIRAEIPQDTKLEDIELNDDRILIIGGISKDFRTIGKIIQLFSDSKNFSDFNIESINRVDDKSLLIEGVKFTFSVTFTPDKVVDSTNT